MTLRFIASRFAQTVAAMAIFSLVVFFLSRAAGDPVRLMVSLDAPEDVIEQVRANLGLDRPVPVQVLLFYRDMLTGNFGTSISSRVPVGDLINARLGASLELAAFAMALSLLLAFPLGVAAAARRGSRLDSAITLLASAGLALPSFWFGIVLITIFAVFLHALPAGGSGSLASVVLPGVTMATFLAAGLVRLLRSSLLEVIAAQFILTARSKGLSERIVLWRHALRNALIPVITLAGTYFVTFISSAVVVEVVFAWPGLGRLTLDAVQARDYPVMQALMLLTAGLAVVVNLVIDVAYAFLDPRIRQQ